MTEEINGLCAVYCDLNIFEHLAFVQLYVENCLYAVSLCCFCNSLVRERPYGDGTYQTDIDALSLELVDSGLCDTGDSAESGDNVLCAFEIVVLPHLLVLDDLSVHCLKLCVMYGQRLGVDVNGVDDTALCRIVAGLPAGACPRLLLGIDLEIDHIGHLNRLHHLSDDAVCDEQHGDAVLLCLVVCEHHDVNCFLNGGGCVSQQVVVAVAAALNCLEVVALRCLNVAEAGAAAHYVQDNAGKHCACAVGDTFLLQGDAGA